MGPLHELERLHVLQGLQRIFADSDLYERNERKCRNLYERCSKDIPEIFFSRHHLPSQVTGPCRSYS